MNMEEPREKRQKIMSDQRRDPILEPLHRYEGEYFEDDDKTIKEEPMYEEDEEPLTGLGVLKQRINSLLQNHLNSQLEIVWNKVRIVLSQKDTLLNKSEDDNTGLENEYLKLHEELKNKNRQIINLTNLVTVAAEKTGKLSIEHERKAQQYEQLIEQKDKQLESCQTNVSQLQNQYNSYLKVFENKSIPIMTLLKRNKVKIDQYDLERKSLKTIILGKEEDLKKMVSKTEHLKNENCANLLMVSQLNDTVQMLEVENKDFKMKIREHTQKSVEAQDLLETKRKANELINKLNVQVNEHKHNLELKEIKVELQKNVIEELKFDCQRLKENKEAELATRDNSHNEALQKLEKDAENCSSHILKLQKENDLLHEKVNQQTDNFLKMTDEKEKIKVYVAEQDARLQQFESSQTEKHDLNLEISKLNGKIELKDAEFILLNLKVDKLQQQNEELMAQLNKTATVEYEEIGSQTKPFDELASVKAQAIPADEISREFGDSTTDNDEYPLVGCSSSSVYAAETIEKEKEKEDQKCVEEAKTYTAIRAPKLASETIDKQKPWALASGQTDMLQCPECPYTLQHHHIKGHFKKKHKALSKVYRSCKGIPGVQSCNQMVSHWALGKHFDQHIQQRNRLVENKRRHKFGLYQRPPSQQPQGQWIYSPTALTYTQAPPPQGPFFGGQSWRW